MVLAHGRVNPYDGITVLVLGIYGFLPKRSAALNLIARTSRTIVAKLQSGPQVPDREAKSFHEKAG
jgi:hypothetical protein